MRHSEAVTVGGRGDAAHVREAVHVREALH
jgi:hypothetical protein